MLSTLLSAALSGPLSSLQLAGPAGHNHTDESDKSGLFGEGFIDATLPRFLIQVLLILVVVRILGQLLYKIKQPMVIGEIIAGVLLGPSVLGFIPGFTDTFFPEESLDYLSLFASVGLIFFMFFLGLEVDPGLMAKTWKTSLPIAIASISVPFGVGLGLASWLYRIEPFAENETAFILFMGTSLAFTAFPVLARILSEAELIGSPVGIQAISVSAIEDLLAWCTLALTLSYANGGNPVTGVYIAVIAGAFVCFLVFVVRRFLFWWYQKLSHRGDENSRTFIACLFFGLIISSWFTEVLGVHAFFGAFVFGLVVPRSGLLIEDLAPKIELLIVEFFLPLYFANSGMRTQLGVLDTAELWGSAMLLTLAASISKVVPATLMSKLMSRGKIPFRESLTLGVLMNARGLVALIVLNIGVDRGIIGPKIFAMCVLLALIATFAASPLLYVLYQRKFHQDEQTALLEELTKEQAAYDQQTSLQVADGAESLVVTTDTGEAGTAVAADGAPATGSDSFVPPSPAARKSSHRALPSLDLSSAYGSPRLSLGSPLAAAAAAAAAIAGSRRDLRSPLSVAGSPSMRGAQTPGGLSQSPSAASRFAPVLRSPSLRARADSIGLPRGRSGSIAVAVSHPSLPLARSISTRVLLMDAAHHAGLHGSGADSDSDDSAYESGYSYLTATANAQRQ